MSLLNRLFGPAFSAAETSGAWNAPAQRPSPAQEDVDPAPEAHPSPAERLAGFEDAFGSFGGFDRF